MADAYDWKQRYKNGELLTGVDNFVASMKAVGKGKLEQERLLQEKANQKRAQLDEEKKRLKNGGRSPKGPGI